MGLLLLLAGVSWRKFCRVGEAGGSVHAVSARACRRRAFHDVPGAGWAGDGTSPSARPAPLLLSINSLSLAPSAANVRLFSVAVRDSSDRAACAACAAEPEEAYVEAAAEGIRAKRCRRRGRVLRLGCAEAKNDAGGVARPAMEGGGSLWRTWKDCLAVTAGWFGRCPLPLVANAGRSASVANLAGSGHPNSGDLLSLR